MRIAEVLGLLRVHLDVLPSRETPAARHQMKAATLKLFLLWVFIGANIVQVLPDLLVRQWMVKWARALLVIVLIHWDVLFEPARWFLGRLVIIDYLYGWLNIILLLPGLNLGNSVRRLDRQSCSTSIVDAPHLGAPQVSHGLNGLIEGVLRQNSTLLVFVLVVEHSDRKTAFLTWRLTIL